MSNLILYTTEDGRSQIRLRTKDETVWLSQREIAQLFDVSTDNVGLHLKNIFKDGELSKNATTEESSVVQIEGGHGVQRPVTLYNLDAILAVGYRVRSPRGVQFRRWGNTVLKDEGVSDQRLREGRRAPKEPGWSPELFRGDARTHPWCSGLYKYLPCSALRFARYPTIALIGSTMAARRAGKNPLPKPINAIKPSVANIPVPDATNGISRI